MTNRPTISEIAELTRRLREVSKPDATEEERDAFIRDKQEILTRIEESADDGSR